ncbi:BrnT family toxin [candidate division KSB1 bacterium]|nr:BrnT family toxin [candidate division KSB1 bacterium]
MRIIDCEWDEWNVDHIREHDVEPYEVKEVFVNRPLIRKGREGKYLAYGQSDSGRYLTIVFAYRGQSRAYPITARDSNQKEKRYAQTQKR